MKRLLISVLFLVLFSATAQAQQDQNRERRGMHNKGDRMAKMQKNLGLSDGQVTQIREIRENGGSRAEMRAVLTDEQRATFDERRRQHQAQRGKAGKGRSYTQDPGIEATTPDDG